MTPQEAGRKGGRTTRRRHGRRHFAELGRRGFAALCARYFGGDKAECMRWLRSRARFWDVDRAATDYLNATGQTCIELDGDLPEDLDPVDWILQSIRSAPLPAVPL